MSAARRTALLGCWTAALVAGLAVLRALAHGPLAAPPLDRGSVGWLTATDPAVAVMALVRTVAEAACWYLLAATAVGVVARAAGVPAAIRLADAWTVAPVRRVLHATLGAGLLVAGWAGPAGATTARVAPDPPVMRWLEGADTDPPAPAADDAAAPPDDLGGAVDPAAAPDGTDDAADRADEPEAIGQAPPPATGEEQRPDPGAAAASGPDSGASAPTTALLPDSEGAAPGLPPDHAPAPHSAADEAEGEPTPPPPVPAPPPESPPPAGRPEAPAIRAVVRGDNFWSIAKAALAEARGRPPTNAEIVPYWRMLIEANRPRLVDPDDPGLLHVGQQLEVPPPP